MRTLILLIVFFSYDELFYADRIFNKDSEIKYDFAASSVKHPLLIFGANYITKVEYKIFQKVNFADHYQYIINIQILCTIIGTIFLFLILCEIFGLKSIYSFLLSLIYLFSNSTIISTIFVESFVYSSTLLILSYYFISKNKFIISGILGVFVFGTTITNIVIWGIMVLFLNNLKDYKSYLKFFLNFVISFFIITIIISILESEYVGFITKNFFTVVFNNVNKFSVDFEFNQFIKSGFYFLFASPLYYINIVDANQLGTGIGSSISFINSANIFITFLTATISSFILLLISTIFKKIDKNILACIMILFFNIGLHLGLKFGLNEAFLYTPHYLFAIILILGLFLQRFIKYKKIIILAFIIILISELIFNFNSINDIIRIASVK